jgi:hypothetical protein
MNDQRKRPVFSTKLVLGLAVIATGIVMILDNLHLYSAWTLLNYWPIVLAAIALAHFLRDGPLNTGGHIWLGFSVAGFISQFGPWGLLERWWPVFVVWGGLLLTLRALFPRSGRIQSKVNLPAPSSPAISSDPEIGPDSRQS